MLTSLWTQLFKMRLFRSGLVLLMLVSVTVVYSAAIKGQNEDFLNFLNEAFNRNSSEMVGTVSGPSNPIGVPDPVTVCSTSSPMENPTGVFPETEIVKYSDTEDERSNENSISVDQTEDRSQQSQEMSGPWDSVTDQKRKRRKDTERGEEEQGVTQITEMEATKMDSYVPNQLRTKERNRKVKAVVTRKTSGFIQLSGRQNIIDQSEECVEVSNWMMGYPDEENTSVDYAGADLLSEEGDTKPRKLCARKILKTPRPQRELDTDSAEKIDSENRSENIPVQNL